MSSKVQTLESAATDERAGSTLALPVHALQGVTPRIAAQLERLGILTVRDLVRHFPFRYDDLRSALSIADLLAARASASKNEGNPEVNILGTIVRCTHVRLRGRIRAKTTAIIDDGSGIVQAVWFGRPYLGSQLKAGSRIFVRGRVEYTLTGASINVSRHRILKPDEPYEGELNPVYAQTAGLHSYDLRRLIHRALLLVAKDERAKEELDPLPEAINRRERFSDAWRALRLIHEPATPEQADEARRRLVYEEFFLLALAAALRRAQRAREPAPDFSALAKAPVQREFHERLRAAFPFALTGAQERVIAEVSADMLKAAPMNRLLQGDVGSGKTAVAIAAMLLAAEAGYQSAFMAPTEVLAAQQFNKISPFLSHTGLRSALLIGALKRRTRDDILEQ
ncbi:MAG TPA: DEAD/DEAH box helicase, partial [Candidatus Eremiobacteraceae bacterium]|nr:DEAD/DEAH box helicase [Candidatus Eremiobacteraceae bacterium]